MIKMPTSQYYSRSKDLDILLSMNDQCVTLLPLLDLCAVFDPVDHALLSAATLTNHSLGDVVKP